MRRTESSLKTEHFDNILQHLSSTPYFGRTCLNQGLRLQIPFQERVGRSRPPAQRGYLLCKDSRTEGVRLGDGVGDWRWSSKQKPLAQFPFESGRATWELRKPQCGWARLQAAMGLSPLVGTHTLYRLRVRRIFLILAQCLNNVLSCPYTVFEVLFYFILAMGLGLGCKWRWASSLCSWRPPSQKQHQRSWCYVPAFLNPPLNLSYLDSTILFVFNYCVTYVVIQSWQLFF